MSDYLFQSRVFRAAAVPLSYIYRAGLSLRPAPHPEHVKARVISIGNIHVGGSGKTPLVIAVARRLFDQGAKPAVVSRGYGGRLSKAGATVTALSAAEDVGDEPREIARALPNVPVFIGADRVEAAKKAGWAARTVVLDDGFQHQRLARDLDVVIIPEECDPARQRLLPWGRLREPLSALQRAHAIVLLGGGDHHTWAQYSDARIFDAERVVTAVRPWYGTVEPTALLGRKVVAFCAIASPGRFTKTLEAAGARVVELFSLRDHAHFSEHDFKMVRILAERHDALAVTTAKDAARIGEIPLPFPAAVLQIEIRCDDFLNTFFS